MKGYVCNKCGKVVTSKDLMKNMTSLKLETDFVGTYEIMHLCDDCKNKFYDWVRRGENDEI